MTTISYKRTGGTMGQEMAINFDLNEMPANLSQRFQNLITESNFFATPVVNEALSRPDEFEYTVTIDAGNSKHTVRTTDSSMPDSLRPLVEGLTKLAETAEK